MRTSVGDQEILISNPDKILFPESGIDKKSLVAYYQAVASFMMPHVEGRPISMERFPDGIDAPHFYQKEAPDYFPPFVERVPVESDGGESKPYVVITNAASIVYLANLVAIPHIWMSRAGALRRPDRIVWDLDPMETDFAAVKMAARLLRYLLDELAIPSYPMLTGSRGLHIVSFLEPRWDVDVTFAFARDVSRLIARKLPQLFTVRHAKSRRGKKVYVDYHRNAHAQTAVAPYAVRALEGGPVAMPVRWEEIDDVELDPRFFNMGNVPARLAERGDAWDRPAPISDLESIRDRVHELLDRTRIAG